MPVAARVDLRIISALLLAIVAPNLEPFCRRRYPLKLFAWAVAVPLLSANGCTTDTSIAIVPFGAPTSVPRNLMLPETVAST